MSLILDALNRSRQDADPVPGLATAHASPPSSELRRYLPWAALAVAVLLIAWLLLDRSEDNKEVDAGIAAPVAQLSRNVGSAAADVTAKLKSRVAAQRESKAREQEAFNNPAPAAPVKKMVAVPAAPAPETVAVAENSAIAALYERQSTRSEAASTPPAETAVTREQVVAKPAEKSNAVQSEEPVDIQKILELARDEMENDGLVDHPAPFISNLSQHVKDTIPTILYQQHEYSEVPSRSTVMLNGKSLRVGGTAGSSIKVDEILPNSVVLSHRGTQFRLRSLNSWVNL